MPALVRQGLLPLQTESGFFHDTSTKARVIFQHLLSAATSKCGQLLTLLCWRTLREDVTVWLGAWCLYADVLLCS
jgi:hypothetical protein